MDWSWPLVRRWLQRAISCMTQDDRPLSHSEIGEIKKRGKARAKWARKGLSFRPHRQKTEPEKKESPPEVSLGIHLYAGRPAEFRYWNRRRKKGRR